MSDLNIALVMRLVDKISSPAKRAADNVERMGNRIGQQGVRNLELADRMTAKNQAYRTALMGPTVAVAGMVYGLNKALGPAERFEKAMDAVAAVSRATASEQTRLGRTARELGATSSFTAISVANGMGFLAKAGFSVNETIAAIPGVLNLAAAAQTDLAKTSDIASNILSGFNLEASEMGRVGDILTNTFTSSNTDLSMLGATMADAAPTAASLGIDLETLAGMAGKLGDAGIQGSKGGTALRAMMIRLSAPPTETAKALKKLNIQTSDADGNMRAFPTILADMHEAMKSMGTAARADIMSAVFGLEAVSAASVLVDQAGSGALQKYILSLFETGEAARVAKEQLDNLAGSKVKLTSALEGLAIAIGTLLLPETQELIDLMTQVVRAATEWVEANPKLAKTIALAAASIVGLMLATVALRWAFLPLRWLITGVVRVIGWLGVVGGSVMMAFAKLARLVVLAMTFMSRGVLAAGAAMLVNPIFLAISAIAAGAYLIYRNWGNLTAYFEAAMERVRAAFERGFGQGVLQLISSLRWSILDYAIWQVWIITDALMWATGIDLYARGQQMMQSLKDGMYSILPKMVSAISSLLSKIVPSWMQRAYEWATGSGPKVPTSGAGTPRSGARSASNNLIVNSRSPRIIRGEFGRPPAAPPVAVNIGDTHHHYPAGIDAEKAGQIFDQKLANRNRELRVQLHDGGSYD